MVHKFDRAQGKFECFIRRKSHWPFPDYDVVKECGLLNRLVTGTRGAFIRSAKELFWQKKTQTVI